MEQHCLRTSADFKQPANTCVARLMVIYPDRCGCMSSLLFYVPLHVEARRATAAAVDVDVGSCKCSGMHLFLDPCFRLSYTYASTHAEPACLHIGSVEVANLPPHTTHNFLLPGKSSGVSVNLVIRVQLLCAEPALRRVLSIRTVG